MLSIQPSDLALRVLRLEQQLESYQRLHAEELDQLRRDLATIKTQVLRQTSPEQGGEPDPMRAT